jgi:hypothetical protein
MDTLAHDLDCSLDHNSAFELNLDYNLVSILSRASALDRDRDMALAIASQVFLDLDRDISPDLIRDLDLEQDLGLDIVSELDVDAVLDLDLDLDLERELILDRDLAVDLALALIHDLVRDLSYDSNLDHDLELDSLAVELEDFRIMWIDTRTESWDSFSEELRNLLVEHRDVGHDWDLNWEQVRTLKRYLHATPLLVSCLDVAYVTDRKAIEERLLKPPQ